MQEWIAERRMAEARRLLVETNLAVEEVGRRVGYGGPTYFVRSFRGAHDLPRLAGAVLVARKLEVLGRELTGSFASAD